MWKKATVAHFKEIRRHFPGGAEEIYGKLDQNSRFSRRYSEPEIPEYEEGVIVNRTQHSVVSFETCAKDEGVKYGINRVLSN